MNQILSRFRLGLRQIVTVVLTAIVFLVAPVFSHPHLWQAQAGDLPVIQADREPLDKGTIKRIQQQAEDLGDGAERSIGDTGLKNLRKLGENIPETIELNSRQKGEIYSDDDTSVKDLERARDRVGKD